MTINSANIIKSDFHTHTHFSDDCDINIDTMIKGAIDRKVQILAITDHYDPGYPDLNFPFDLDFKNYFSTLIKKKNEFKDEIDLRFGVEFGLLQGHFNELSKVIGSYPFDVVIGSFHCTRNVPMHDYDFSKIDKDFALKDFYSYMYECLQEYNDFDILGHLSIIDRYMGKELNYSLVEDELYEILKFLIKKEKCIEINTSNFRYKTGTWLPRESILKKYLELGGELISFGSDSHTPDYYQFHFNDAVEFAKSLGFDKHCIYQNRKVKLLPL